MYYDYFRGYSPFRKSAEVKGAHTQEAPEHLLDAPGTPGYVPGTPGGNIPYPTHYPGYHHGIGPWYSHPYWNGYYPWYGYPGYGPWIGPVHHPYYGPYYPQRPGLYGPFAVNNKR